MRACSVRVRALAFDTNDELLAIVDIAGADHLFLVDLGTLQGTDIGDTGLVGIQAMAVRSDGTIFGFDTGPNGQNGEGLVRIDRTTGLATDVSLLSGGDATQVQGMGFTSDGRLIGGRDELFEINVGHGTLSLIGSGGFTDVRGLDFFGFPAVPFVYCVPDATHCGPAIDFSGVPSASAGSGFSILATGIPSNRAGILFYGLTGPNDSPFQGGTLCVKAPLKRSPLLNSGGSGACGGGFDFDFNTHVANVGDAALIVGATVDCQFWFRDTTDFVFGTGLTDAVEFQIGN